MKTACAMRSIVLLAAALLTLQPSDASALFGFNPCRTCRGFLIFCCPKPCPVADRVHRANERRIRSTNAIIEEILFDTTRTVDELHRTFGQPTGPSRISAPARAPRQAPGNSRFAATGDIGPAIPSAPSPSIILELLQPRPHATEGQALEYLQNNAILDAAQAHQTLTWAVSRAEETAAAGGRPHPPCNRHPPDASPQSPDAGPHCRRSALPSTPPVPTAPASNPSVLPSSKTVTPPRNTLPPTIPR